jgi:hypothetical protein
MRIRMLHLLPDNSLCYTSMDTFKPPLAWTIIESEHIQVLIQYPDDVDRMIHISDHAQPEELADLIASSKPYLIENFKMLQFNLN